MAAISNAIVGVVRDYTGRGPTKARTTIRDKTVLVMLEDTLTKGEETLVNNGRGDKVLELRFEFQGAIRAEASKLGQKGRAPTSRLSPIEQGFPDRPLPVHWLPASASPAMSLSSSSAAAWAGVPATSPSPRSSSCGWKLAWTAIWSSPESSNTITARPGPWTPGASMSPTLASSAPAAVSTESARSRQ